MRAFFIGAPMMPKLLELLARLSLWFVNILLDWMLILIPVAS